MRARLSGAAGEPGSLSDQRPIGSGGGCQSAWTVSRASASAPNGCPHPHSVPAFSAASPTPAFRAAGGATSLAASLLSQLSLSGRVRAQQVPRGWALLPRAARLCARGNDAGPETRPLRVRVTCVRGPLTSQPRPGPATPDTLGATKSEHEPRLSRTLWGREKKKKKRIISEPKVWAFYQRVHVAMLVEAMPPQYFPRICQPSRASPDF